MSVVVPPPKPPTATAIAAGGEEAAALRRAAEVLAYARHPGIPELLGVRSDGERTEVETAVPEGVPLHALALTLEEAAGVAATVATTVADLHDIGVAVGGVGIEGVAVTSDGQAVLTDFTRAARLPGPRAQWPTHPLVRRDDRDVGRLLCDLLDHCTPSALSDALERPRLRRRRARRAGPVAAARWLAERAATGGLTSRRLAEHLATEVAGARLPRRDRADLLAARAHVAERASEDLDPGDSGATLGDDAFDRWFGGLAEDDVAEQHPPERPQPGWCPPERQQTDWHPPEGPQPEWHPPVGHPPARRRLSTRWAIAAGCVPALIAGIALGRPWATSSPVPCAASECVVYRAGVLSVNGTQYAVGRAGDVVAVGHWWCSAPSVALLRPATGQVWLYRAWPSAGAATPPTLGTTVQGARTLTVASRAGCDALLVERRGAPPVRVVVPDLP